MDSVVLRPEREILRDLQKAHKELQDYQSSIVLPGIIPNINNCLRRAKELETFQNYKTARDNLLNEHDDFLRSEAIATPKQRALEERLTKLENK